MFDLTNVRAKANEQLAQSEHDASDVQTVPVNADAINNVITQLNNLLTTINSIKEAFSSASGEAGLSGLLDNFNNAAQAVQNISQAIGTLPKEGDGLNTILQEVNNIGDISGGNLQHIQDFFVSFGSILRMMEQQSAATSGLAGIKDLENLFAGFNTGNAESLNQTLMSISGAFSQANTENITLFTQAIQNLATAMSGIQSTLGQLNIPLLTDEQHAAGIKGTVDALQKFTEMDLSSILGKDMGLEGIKTFGQIENIVDGLFSKDRKAQASDLIKPLNDQLNEALETQQKYNEKVNEITKGAWTKDSYLANREGMLKEFNELANEIYTKHPSGNDALNPRYRVESMINAFSQAALGGDRDKETQLWKESLTDQAKKLWQDVGKIIDQGRGFINGNNLDKVMQSQFGFEGKQAIDEQVSGLQNLIQVMKQYDSIKATRDTSAQNYTAEQLGDEAGKISGLKGAVDDVTSAVQAKTEAFTAEGESVSAAVQAEAQALEQLKTALEGISQFFQGENNFGEVFTSMVDKINQSKDALSDFAKILSATKEQREQVQKQAEEATKKQKNYDMIGEGYSEFTPKNKEAWARFLNTAYEKAGIEPTDIDKVLRSVRREGENAYESFLVRTRSGHTQTIGADSETPIGARNESLKSVTGELEKAEKLITNLGSASTTAGIDRIAESFKSVGDSLTMMNDAQVLTDD